jgi:hypothetical protein
MPILKENPELPSRLSCSGSGEVRERLKLFHARCEPPNRTTLHRTGVRSWIPNDPTLVAQILKISSAYSPPPPEGFVSPMTWGVESNVVERFGGAGISPDRVTFARDTYTFRFAGMPSEFVTAFRQYYGPTMNAFEAAGKSGREADLQKELEALFERHNTSSVPGLTMIPATFLRVTVMV